MLYYVALLLTPFIDQLNVFSYHTVRSGAAALTGFFFCLLVGPRMIYWLRILKIGQHIKKDYVADLHELHKGKTGTPTMGGVLIIISTLVSLLLWSNLVNRLLLIVTGVLVMLGIVGFIDDFIKLRRHQNDGLSARAKMIGQILTGLLLGLVLYFFPITVGTSFIKNAHVTDWQGLVYQLTASQGGAQPGPAGRIWERLSPILRQRLQNANPDAALDKKSRLLLLAELNAVLDDPTLFDADTWKNTPLNGDSVPLIQKGVQKLTTRELTALNRGLVEAAFPDSIAKGTKNLHTKIEIPGFKGLFISLGPLYILFVVVIIVCTSNAVNLTDGLDGLAAGAASISLLAFTGIAYVVSRVDWSEYLYVIYVPEASELTVFGAAMLGTGLGFLWFNSHPAEVFMGDTGSLALGGVIGTMAILTKQELLLPVVAGLFVLEALSVVIQVAGFKLTGKRVFRMAPLHHHFELKGWSETKVTIRFWIIAILFALMSLGTLKLR
ncbi:MAG TPA: phospho-N-acetylmuramoyl-pentapeptide-transferase [Candidatus Bathyarchaeia archaeon]|nr:phospho-N-acetylmuramoyl-pentapeptide-transferase [Candidatus Bathyarchaeia archaeon]